MVNKEFATKDPKIFVEQEEKDDNEPSMMENKRRTRGINPRYGQ